MMEDEKQKCHSSLTLIWSPCCLNAAVSMCLSERRETFSADVRWQPYLWCGRALKRRQTAAEATACTINAGVTEHFLIYVDMSVSVWMTSRDHLSKHSQFVHTSLWITCLWVVLLFVLYFKCAHTSGQNAELCNQNKTQDKSCVSELAVSWVKLQEKVVPLIDHGEICMKEIHSFFRFCFIFPLVTL